MILGPQKNRKPKQKQKQKQTTKTKLKKTNGNTLSSFADVVRNKLK